MVVRAVLLLWVCLTALPSPVYSSLPPSRYWYEHGKDRGNDQVQPKPVPTKTNAPQVGIPPPNLLSHAHESPRVLDGLSLSSSKDQKCSCPKEAAGSAGYSRQNDYLQRLRAQQDARAVSGDRMESRAGGLPGTLKSGVTLPTIVVNGKPRPWPGSRNITWPNGLSVGSAAPSSLGGLLPRSIASCHRQVGNASQDIGL